MRLDRPFLKLPIRFDADALAAEVRALPPSAWAEHPSGFEGNEAVRLVTVGGKPSDDFHGEMGPTEQLLACPYIMEIMAEHDAKSPMFKKINQSLRTFQRDQLLWERFSEFRYNSYMTTAKL